MGFLNPGALYYLLALIPALATAYLVRERPRRIVVSSVLAFRALRARRGQRFGGWPRPDWMFFLELLIIGLAVLAILALREAGIELPPSTPESLVILALGALATVFVLIRVITIPDAVLPADSRGIGLWIALLASLGVIAGGLLRAAEDF